MAKTIYAIRDNKVGTYFPPNFSDHLTQLTRALQELVINKSEHQFHKYPGDFELFELGSYDENTAKIGQLQDPKFIMTLSELQQGE